MAKKEKIYKLRVTSTEEYELHIRTTADEDEVIARWRSFDGGLFTCTYNYGWDFDSLEEIEDPEDVDENNCIDMEEKTNG